MTDRSFCIREIARYEQLVARLETISNPNQAQRDALASARRHLAEERAALDMLNGLAGD